MDSTEEKQGKMEDFDDIQLKEQLDKITKTIDDILKRVEAHEGQINNVPGDEGDDSINCSSWFT